MEENNNIEKAVEQLSGRVTLSQKEYFSKMEGSFSDKVANLIELHKNKVAERGFVAKPNIDAIEKAIATIIKNVITMEANANIYIEDFNNTFNNKVEELQKDAEDFNNLYQDYQALVRANETLIENGLKYQNKAEELEIKCNDKEQAIKTLTEKNNKLMEDKIKVSQYIDQLKEDKDNIKKDFEEKIEKLNDNIVSLDKLVATEVEKKLLYSQQVQELKNDMIEEKKNHKEEVKAIEKKLDNLRGDFNTLHLHSQKAEIELKNKLELANIDIERKNKEINSLTNSHTEEIERLTKLIEELKKTTN